MANVYHMTIPSIKGERCALFCGEVGTSHHHILTVILLQQERFEEGNY